MEETCYHGDGYQMKTALQQRWSNL